LRGAERRARILDAATEVFAERGYAGASMGEIASRAGVVASVIYDHFGSKRELAIVLLRGHGERLVSQSLTNPPPGLEPRELMRWSIDAFFRLVEEDRFAWRFLFRDPPADPEIAAAWREIDDAARNGIAALIRGGTPDEVEVAGLPSDEAAEMLAKASQEVTKGLAEWWWDNRSVPREQLVGVSFALLWEGFAGILRES
jgi:AcrR family transcriptional regulator